MIFDQKSSTSRIARNTLFLYVRMLLSMIVALYTSRVILNALGVQDFGIYGVVGGLVSMFSLISSSLSSSISRFITFELGRGDIEKLKAIFATSMLIQVLLSGIILTVAETLGLWFLNKHMVIPVERMTAANWVYQATIFSFILGLIGTPFSAEIVAHERMDVFASLGILDVFVKLGIALFIAYAPFVYDRLIIYSLLLVFFSTIMKLIYWRFCYKHFPETHTSLRFNKSCWKEMSGFAGWNTIGCTAGILKDQGVNVLLNLFFGPVVNAARAIGGQVNGAVGGFAGNFMTALNPQIIKGFASDDKRYTFYLVERGSRFSFYIIMVLIIPIIISTPFILDLWLGEYPDHTVSFVRLTLICSLIDILSNTLITLQVATGKIRNYQLVVGSLLLLNFPLSLIALKMNLPPESVYIVAVLVSVICLGARLFFLRKMVGLSIGSYVKNVIWNVTMAFFIAFIPALLLSCLVKPVDIVNLLILTFFSFVISTATILFVSMSANEREFIFSRIKCMHKRLLRKAAA